MGLIPFSHGLVLCEDTRNTLDHSATPLKKGGGRYSHEKRLENQNDQTRTSNVNPHINNRANLYKFQQRKCQYRSVSKGTFVQNTRRKVFNLKRLEL